MGIASDIFYVVVFLIGFLNLAIQLIKSKIIGLYISERLGNVRFILKDSVIIHCVSVGELIGCKLLIELFKKKFPQKVVITTSTATGYNLARKIYSDLMVCFFPMDFGFVINKFLRKTKPRAIILMETELWPNLVLIAKKQGIKIFVVNGRISEKAFKRYLLIREIMKRVLKIFDGIYVQNEEYSKRFISLGARKKDVFIVGNMKFDVVNDYDDFDVEKLKREYYIGDSEKVWVCGSTHWPEEKFIIQVFKNLKNVHGTLRLIIVPRHFKKLDEIQNYARKEGLNIALKSKMDINSAKTDILVVDKIGELRKLYGISDCVFVGGSIVNHGGQNIIEPTVFSKPVIFGPYIQNFRQPAEELIRLGGGVLVNSIKELEITVDRFLSDEELLKTMGSNAYSFFLKNRGSSYKIFDLIVSNIKS